MNWGWKITIGVSLFIVMILTMVVVSMRTDFHLVADDYYRQEIEYQHQIDRMENLNRLEQKPDIRYESGKQLLELYFPTALNKASGEVHLFRPSNGSWDRRFQLALNMDGKQEISVADLPKGLWKVRMQWSDQQVEYFEERKVYLK